MNPELSLLNHVIKTRDIITPLASNIETAFVQYAVEWDWMRQYYEQYKEVPSADVFFGQFKELEQFNTDGVIEFYIEELHKYKAKRTLTEVIHSAAEDIRSKGPYAAINTLNKHLAQLGRETRLVRDIDLIANADERLESLRSRLELRKSGRSILGVPTGINKLDEMYGGLQKGDYWVIAAWSGQLKSWLALYMATNAWRLGYRVMYFSLELSHEQIGYRFDTLLAGGAFKNSELTHAQESLVFDSYKNWQDTNFKDKQPFIVVTNEDLDTVNQHTVQAKIDTWKPDLVIIDYLQLLDEASGITGETERIKELSKAFKRMAIRNGTPIIVITSVTQDKKDIGRKPAELYELAWSKQPAYDSDLCLTLCKDDDILWTKAVKTRRSAEFQFFLQWDIDKGIVKELSKYVPEQADSWLDGP